MLVVADVEADEVLVPELHGAYFTPAMELEAYLVEQVGIKTGAGDYAARLIAAGISSPEQFAEVSLEALGERPFVFTQRHVELVETFRSGSGGDDDVVAAAPGVVSP